MKLGRLADSGEELYNVASIAACWQIYVLSILKISVFYILIFFIAVAYQ
jgi:hypothetical protein